MHGENPKLKRNSLNSVYTQHTYMHTDRCRNWW